MDWLYSMFKRKSPRQDMVIPHKKADNHYDSGVDQVNFFLSMPQNSNPCNQDAKSSTRHI